ncbi:hypothetical protein TSAR_000632 [Trichomalopsis sarcophagae]|uniref:Myb-like domain-containing protein n=1 Tax=Trichomalopsis sarcophagae TaxID=543379 RepID=A0A232EPP2_9HYME|nr:hypothetical protein TSAR_000632 [Trichomalopsis sarcophagae]
MDESAEKSSVSFSFSLDLDSVVSDSSLDSDATDDGLQIDVAEVDDFNNDNTTKLRRQVTVDETSFLNEMEEEIERQLDAKAAKSNLTATNVKNILKHVISHEHVRAMVNKRLTKGDDDIVFEPKLTRAKAKELALAQPDIPWPMTPVKTTTSEVQVLIQEEFPEDSSDEEYQPDQDPPSDDDKDVDNSVGSDMDSQPRTPATPCELSASMERAITPDVQYDQEGVFKVPQNIPHVPTEEESIGHRTRSKLCLSETPLEQIEQAFIPPDITTDMYDWDWEPEDEYINFLKELYTQPIPKEINIDDDPEADPEYNILEDEDIELLDKEEELREDKAVKITKKELKTLIAELDEFADQFAKQHEQEQQRQQLLQQQQQQQHKISKKKRTPDSSFVSMETSFPGNPMVELLPVLAEPELPEIVNPHQRYLISVQLSQHVQLMAQQFIMTYKHPMLHKHSQICKDNLGSLRTLGAHIGSEFIAQNLADAFQLVSDWELKFTDETFSKEYAEFLDAEIEQEKIFFKTKRKYKNQFHPELIKLMVDSKALMHPQLLPTVFPNSTSIHDKLKYLSSEEHLIAIGLEQFIPYMKSLNKRFNKDCHIFADAVKEIQKYLLPTKDVKGMIMHIKRRKIAKIKNPIKHYYITGSAPRTEHCVLNKYDLKAPIDQPIIFLPPFWKNMIDNIRYGTLEEFLCFTKSKKIDYDDEFLPVSHDEIMIHKDHELRNPIVNVMRNMPSLMTPQKADTSTSSSKSGSSANSSKPKITQSRVNEAESDAESAESMRTCETDEEESRPTRLRMTTPRLAKIKSVQNMKLMAQNLSPKVTTSSTNTINENKDYSDKNDDDASSFSKGDNEDEIAELMLASTTIKKNTASRKKTKQARELENLKRLLEAENSINECDRATKFAASYIQKISMKVESKDPELYRAVFKLFLDYSEKIENLDQNNGSDYFLDENASLPGGKNLQVTERKDIDRDKLAVELYKEVNEKLQEYPDLLTDFLLFLTPHQAALVDKSVEHTHLLKMREFVQVTEMYFAKQPSRIGKVMQAMTQISSDPFVTIETAQAVMGAALKGHPLIMDLFLQILPTGKPPERLLFTISLFAAHMFENLLCPVGPHDKNKAYDADAPEFYENIELPVSTPQEDPYGGDSCKCDCHNFVDSKAKGTNEHCASCGTRFLNGRIYLQTSEGLRPAKITFPGADDEKLENISRVSLKTTERFVPCPPPRKRRKSSKRDSLSEESNVKPCSSKGSPTKDSLEESDKPLTKSNKKGMKSPSKSIDSKKLVKSASVKSKREKRTDKKDVKFEPKTDDDQNEFGPNTDNTEFEEGIGCNTTNDEYVDLFGSKLGEISTDSHEDDALTSPEKVNVSFTNVEKLDNSSDSDSSTNLETELSAIDTPWTMQEDKILLENVQKEYSEKTFNLISASLKNRSVHQVKERCEYLLSLIEKMA